MPCDSFLEGRAWLEQNSSAAFLVRAADVEVLESLAFMSATWTDSSGLASASCPKQACASGCAVEL